MLPSRSQEAQVPRQQHYPQQHRPQQQQQEQQQQQRHQQHPPPSVSQMLAWPMAVLFSTVALLVAFGRSWEANPELRTVAALEGSQLLEQLHAAAAATSTAGADATLDEPVASDGRLLQAALEDLRVQSQMHTQVLNAQIAALESLHRQVNAQSETLASAAEKIEVAHLELYRHSLQLHELSVGMGQSASPSDGAMDKTLPTDGTTAGGGAACQRGYSGDRCLAYAAVIRSAQEVLYTLREVHAVNITLTVAPSEPGPVGQFGAIRCNGVQFIVSAGRVVTLQAPGRKDEPTAAESTSGGLAVEIRDAHFTASGTLTELRLVGVHLHGPTGTDTSRGAASVPMQFSVKDGAALALTSCQLHGASRFVFVDGSDVHDTITLTNVVFVDGLTDVVHSLPGSQPSTVVNPAGKARSFTAVDTQWLGGHLHMSSGWMMLVLQGCLLNNVTLAVDLLDSSSTISVLSSELSRSRGGFRMVQDGGSGPAISFVDTVIANHTGSIVACGGEMRSIDVQEHAQAAVRFERCAVVQNHSPHAGNERTTNTEDAVIDLGSCVAPVPVHVDETVWLDNAIAVVHTGTGSVIVQGSTFTASKVGMFSFGGKLDIRDSQFEALSDITLATCRHIADCEVLMSRCVVIDSISSAIISMCSGNGVTLSDSRFEGAKGGSLLTCTSVHEEQTQANVKQLLRDDNRCGPLFPLPSGQAAQCHPNREPCCSDSGWCGSSEQHCNCDGCVDYSPKDDGAWAEFGESRAEKVESLVPSPHHITWDGRQAGEIMDGGKDMYGFPPYGGNRISTSLCKQTRLAPFGDNFELHPSDCFGPGGSYRMDMRDSMLVLVTKNYANAELDIYITGSTGADGHGVKTTRQFRSGTLQGFGSTLCGASGDPAIHHMFIIDAMLSPHAKHIHDGVLDSDDDAVHGIGPGSPVLYMLYSSVSGGSGCLTEDQHRSIFHAAVRTYVSPFPVSVNGCTLKDNHYDSPLFEAHPAAKVTVQETKFSDNVFSAGLINARSTLLVNKELVGASWTTL